MITTIHPLGRHAPIRRSLAFPPPGDIHDQAADDIVAALVGGAMRDFDLACAVVVADGDVQGRVVVRMDGRAWTLPSLEAAVLALRIRLEPGLRGADLFADAFALASRSAEAKVDAVHRWSRDVRPTQDVE
ncbi:MAG: hypothetical protein LCH57_01795 [Proteobacteria bacterium]|nr:hypothetical protein [Pseudomonadota bacterium]